MIICHELELIFLKTKKVGGTSFEIAFSSQCGPDCVITPISPVDEATRQALGYRGPQNHLQTGLKGLFFPRRRVFTRHMAADRVRKRLPARVWNSYRKFTIVRNPFDRALSRYFWDVKRGRSEGLEFDEFFRRHPDRLTENMRIAPLDGPDKIDFYLRYEHLEEDLAANDLGFLWGTFQGLRAKSGHRPSKGGTPAEMYSAHPDIAQLIAEVCRAEINRFGYEAPVQSQDA